MGHASRVVAKGRDPKAFNSETLAKLRKAYPIQRPQVQGATYRPLRVETNSKASSHPVKKETYSTKLHLSSAQRLRASKAKPQSKPHGAEFIIHTVIRNTAIEEWSAEQRKAWKAHNKSNPTNPIHY